MAELRWLFLEGPDEEYFTVDGNQQKEKTEQMAGFEPITLIWKLQPRPLHSDKFELYVMK